MLVVGGLFFIIILSTLKENEVPFHLLGLMESISIR